MCFWALQARLVEHYIHAVMQALLQRKDEETNFSLAHWSLAVARNFCCSRLCCRHSTSQILQCSHVLDERARVLENQYFKSLLLHTDVPASWCFMMVPVMAIKKRYIGFGSYTISPTHLEALEECYSAISHSAHYWIAFYCLRLNAFLSVERYFVFRLCLELKFTQTILVNTGCSWEYFMSHLYTFCLFSV